MAQSRFGGERRSVVAILASSAMLAGMLIGIVVQAPAALAAPVTSVKGSACGYYTNVGLFGGPQGLEGCGQVGGQATSTSPSVALPANGSGSSTALTASDGDGASATYGPAVVFGGRWPENVANPPPPSGPMSVSTQGTPASGTVTSTADISLYPPPGHSVTCTTGFSPPCYAPGGFGPWPVEGDSVHVSCTASSTGVVGSTTLSHAQVAHSTDPEGSPNDGKSGRPNDTEDIPDNPPPNFTRHGVITNVGDVFTVVFNEQVVHSDGSLTVNGVHMYLFGPTAVGEIVKGSASCGTTPSAIAATDTVAPTCGTPVIKPTDASNPTPLVPRQVLVGVFDAGNGGNTGLQSISNIQVTNGTVTVGQPDSSQQYLRFTPGMTGPLPINARRINENLPMSFSFDAVDVAGNVTHCSVPDAGPTTISVNDISVNEGNSGTTPATFTVTRSGTLNVGSTVKYTTSGGNATGGTDYTSVPPTVLTFNPAEVSKTVTVDVIGDTAVEADETFNLVLSAPQGAVLADTSATATIVDDDGATFLRVNDILVNEGSSGTTPATFTITRSGNTSGSSTVSYKTSGGTATAGTDYTAIPSTAVTFTPGETTKTVTVDVAADTVPEANETFNLVLTGPSGAALADSSGTATIADDDGGAYLGVADVVVNEGNSGSTPVTFTITRSGNTTGTSKVSYKTSGGTATADADYTAVPLTQVTFAPGETTKTVTTSVIGDTAAEPNETFNLVLSAATGATLADTSGTATIVDDDTVPPKPGPATFLSVANIFVTEGNSGTTPATFTVTRSGDTSGTSTVKYATTGGNATAGTDYTAILSTTLTFNPGEASKQVTVSVTGDTLPEANETFNLALSSPTGAVISDGAATATIVNDDGATFLSVDDPRANEGAGQVTFTVTRSGNTSGTSTVKYATSGGNATAGTDYTAVPSTVLTFDPGQTAKTITVAVADDTAKEANETFNLALSSPTGAVVSDGAGTATILNDDGAAYLAVSNVTAAEGDSGTTPFTFTITRSGNTSGTSTVNYATGGGTAVATSDYTPVTGSLTFAASETTKTVTVNVIGETTIEASETFNLTLSAPVGAVLSDAAGTGTILDDDSAAYLSVNDVTAAEGNSGTTPFTFTVTRSGNTTTSFTVYYETIDGTAKDGFLCASSSCGPDSTEVSDYGRLFGQTLTFAVGETTKTVTVNVLGDTTVEPNETFTLGLDDPTANGVPNTWLLRGDGRGTIVNDD